MDFIDDFNLKHKSLRFYLREHEKIAEGFSSRLEKIGSVNKEFNEVFAEAANGLKPILLKIMAELRSLLEMLDHVDLYRAEYEEMLGKEDDEILIEAGEDEEKHDKMRKFGIIKLLKHYQDRYDHICSGVCGENKFKIDADKFLL